MSIKWNLAKSIKALRQPRGIYDLIKLSHSGFTQDWYLCNNAEDIIYNNNTYMTAGFVFKSANRKEQSGASLGFSNVDKRIHKQINLAIKANPNENIICEHSQVSVEVWAGMLVPDEISNLETFEVTNIEITKESIACGISVRNSLLTNSSKHLFSPSKFPNIYL